MKYFIDGTCCLFKSSTLLKLQSEGVPVLVGDFYEHSIGVPLLLKKNQDPTTDLIYQAFVSSRLKDDHVNDRLPFTNILYALVFSIIRGEKTIDDTKKYFKLMKKLDIFPQSWRAVILLSSDSNAVLQKMKERCNGIDMMNIEYVNVQNSVFDCFAKEFNLPTLDIDVKRPVEMINTIRAFVHYLRGSCVVLTGMNTTLKIVDKNAGIDLTSLQRYELKKGVVQKIQLNEMCLIPLGYCGMLFPRSSWHNRIQQQTGIIDVGYSEELSTTVIPLVDCTLEEGERFCQIVILSIPERRSMQVSKDAIHSRGGYGSTGRF